VKHLIPPTVRLVRALARWAWDNPALSFVITAFGIVLVAMTAAQVPLIA